MAKAVTKAAPVAASAETKPTLSSRIRELAATNMSRSDIVKKVSGEFGRPVKYQHVRNVLVTPLKRTAEQAE